MGGPRPLWCHQAWDFWDSNGQCIPGAGKCPQRAWVGAGKSDPVILPLFQAPSSCTLQERGQELWGGQPCVSTLAFEAASASCEEGAKRGSCHPGPGAPPQPQGPSPGPGWEEGRPSLPGPTPVRWRRVNSVFLCVCLPPRPVTPPAHSPPPGQWPALPCTGEK